jgi:hypothetical protein
MFTKGDVMAGSALVGLSSSDIPIDNSGPLSSSRPIEDSTMRKVLTCIPVITFFMQASNVSWHNAQRPILDKKAEVLNISICHEKCAHGAHLLSLLIITVVTAIGVCNPFLAIGALVLLAGSIYLSNCRLEHYQAELNII